MKNNIQKNISVIIPTYYRYKVLNDLLDQLSKQTMSPHEVIIIDQTPLQDRKNNISALYKNKLPIKLFIFDEPSLSKPRNYAAKKSSGDILLFCDDDIVVKSDFIESHYNVMLKENVDVVNGATTLKNKLPESYPWDINVMDPVRYFLAAPNFKWSGMMLSISSCNVSIKRDIFIKSGGFDEKIPRMVDFELGFRLFKMGAKIYYSDKPAVKHLRASGGSRKYSHRHNILVASLYIHKKHFPGWISNQFIIKEIFGPLFEKWTIKTFPRIILHLIKYFKANKELKRILSS